MSIRIIDEPEIMLTRAEHDLLQQEYEKYRQYCVDPVSFETYVQGRIQDRSKP